MQILASDTFREIVDEIKEAVFVVDSTGKVVFANSSACTLTGKSMSDLVGTDVLSEFAAGKGAMATALLVRGLEAMGVKERASV